MLPVPTIQVCQVVYNPLLSIIDPTKNLMGASDSDQALFHHRGEKGLLFSI